MRDTVVSAFRFHFDLDPTLVIRSPGRVNLIGDHTDYNGGFVLPMAIQLGTWMAARPRADTTVRLVDADFGVAEFDLSMLTHGGPAWVEYVKGVAWAMGADRGFDATIAGDLPIGAGLSSSASLELAAARTISGVSNRVWDPLAAARDSQRAENDWVGMACGIMDQLVIAAAVRYHALMIDCDSLETVPCPIPLGATVVVLDTGTRRELADSAYNDRRLACEDAARFLGVRQLRDLTSDDLQRAEALLEDGLARRVRHVVTENERTEAASRLMAQGDAPAMGQLMFDSHASLRDDFEVSSLALDVMVDAAAAAPGVHGARMTGGGFGGSAVALVETASVEIFIEETTRRYRSVTAISPTLIVCEAAAGVEIV